MAHLTQHKHCISRHSTQHEHRISRYSIATYPLQLDFMRLSLWPSHGSSDSPEIPLPLVRMQCNVTEFFTMSCPTLHVAAPPAQVQSNAAKSFMTPCWILHATESPVTPRPILAKFLVQVQYYVAMFFTAYCMILGVYLVQVHCHTAKYFAMSLD